jgi:hypothetical protein
MRVCGETGRDRGNNNKMKRNRAQLSASGERDEATRFFLHRGALGLDEIASGSLMGNKGVVLSLPSLSLSWEALVYIYVLCLGDKISPPRSAARGVGTVGEKIAAPSSARPHFLAAPPVAGKPLATLNAS